MMLPTSKHCISRTASACRFPAAGQDCESCQPPHPVVCLQTQPGDAGRRGAPPGHAERPHSPQIWAAPALAGPALGWGGLNPSEQAVSSQLSVVITQSDPEGADSLKSRARQLADQRTGEHNALAVCRCLRSVVSVAQHWSKLAACAAAPCLKDDQPYTRAGPSPAQGDPQTAARPLSILSPTACPAGGCWRGASGGAGGGQRGRAARSGEGPRLLRERARTLQPHEGAVGGRAGLHGGCRVSAGNTRGRGMWAHRQAARGSTAGFGVHLPALRYCLGGSKAWLGGTCMHRGTALRKGGALEAAKQRKACTSHAGRSVGPQALPPPQV